MTGSENQPVYTKGDIVEVVSQIRIQMELCEKAWLGLGKGNVLILKDESKGLITWYDYEDGQFTFHDGRGGSQVVAISEITEISGC